MAKAGEVTVDVNVKMAVPDETVERCLRLIEYWLNDNPDKKIVGGVRYADGKVDGLRIERRENA